MPRGATGSKRIRIGKGSRANRSGGRVQAPGGEFKYGLNLLPRQVELVDDFVKGGSGFKVLEDGGHGHPGIAEHPCSA